eukprot:TRINITY_DN6860_c0_g1_i1.p2 TRINITY_DN6860_c0_g1~~TRINITY_DN6860_c0_g1_i1.p2  ORF type:complete len:446 (-),score=206.59 TRINITY_DN6860_c0_g1_i1:32-1369(-)
MDTVLKDMILQLAEDHLFYSHDPTRKAQFKETLSLVRNIAEKGGKTKIQLENEKPAGNSTLRIQLEKLGVDIQHGSQDNIHSHTLEIGHVIFEKNLQLEPAGSVIGVNMGSAAVRSKSISRENSKNIQRYPIVVLGTSKSQENSVSVLFQSWKNESFPSGNLTLTLRSGNVGLNVKPLAEISEFLSTSDRKKLMLIKSMAVSLIPKSPVPGNSGKKIKESQVENSLIEGLALDINLLQLETILEGSRGDLVPVSIKSVKIHRKFEESRDMLTVESNQLVLLKESTTSCIPFNFKGTMERKRNVNDKWGAPALSISLEKSVIEITSRQFDLISEIVKKQMAIWQELKRVAQIAPEMKATRETMESHLKLIENSVRDADVELRNLIEISSDYTFARPASQQISRGRSRAVGNKKDEPETLKEKLINLQNLLEEVKLEQFAIRSLISE